MSSKLLTGLKRNTRAYSCPKCLQPLTCKDSVCFHPAEKGGKAYAYQAVLSDRRTRHLIVTHY